MQQMKQQGQTGYQQQKHVGSVLWCLFSCTIIHGDAKHRLLGTKCRKVPSFLYTYILPRKAKQYMLSSCLFVCVCASHTPVLL